MWRAKAARQPHSNSVEGVLAITQLYLGLAFACESAGQSQASISRSSWQPLRHTRRRPWPLGQSGINPPLPCQHANTALLLVGASRSCGTRLKQLFLLLVSFADEVVLEGDRSSQPAASARLWAAASQNKENRCHCHYCFLTAVITLLPVLRRFVNWRFLT